MPSLPGLKARLANGDPVHIVLYGDSISEVGRSPTWFGGASSPATNYGPVLAGRLAARYPQSAFTVQHFAIGGQNTYEGLGRLDSLLPMKPNLVIVAFGANDCGYHFLDPEASARALMFIVKGVRERTGADVVVVGSGGNNPTRVIAWRHFDETVAAMRAMAAEVDAPWADTRGAILAATRQGEDWVTYHNGLENCHPNDAGHGVWAAAAEAAILAALAE